MLIDIAAAAIGIATLLWSRNVSIPAIAAAILVLRHVPGGLGWVLAGAIVVLGNAERKNRAARRR